MEAKFKPGDLVFPVDNPRAREFLEMPGKPLLVVRRLSNEKIDDVIWAECFGYFYDAHQRKVLRVPVEEYVIVMDAMGVIKTCTVHCVEPATWS